MNRFTSYISNYFQKDISHYPELYQKNKTDIAFTINMDMAGGFIYHDTHDVPRPLDWKLF